MKLIEDNGDVIASFPDSAAVMIVCGGELPHAFLEKVRGKVAVTEQAQLVTAIIDYLKIPGNIDHIIASTLPRRRIKHQHN